MSTRFEVIVDGQSAIHRPSRVERLDRGDPRERRLSHCFRDESDGWAWGDGPTGTYYARFGNTYPFSDEESTEPADWSYIVHFCDGTRGTVRVRAINRALELLGARIDLDSTP